MGIRNDPAAYQNVEKEGKPDQCKRVVMLAGVCLGLMCILQAVLNIVLRLYIPTHVHTACNNQTTFRDELQIKYNHIQKRLQDYVLLPNDDEQVKKQGWLYFDNSIYYISSESKNWAESRQDCMSRKADLVIISSREEQEFLNIIRGHKTFWIGLTDQEKEGVWKWVDGTGLNTERFFYDGEPNNFYGSEDCCAMGYLIDKPVLHTLDNWNDLNCSFKLAGICEKKF